MVGPEELIVVGKLGKTRGLNGEMYVYPTSDQPERFVGLKKIYLRNRLGWEEADLASSRLIGVRAVIRLKGVSTPEEAARFVNREVGLPREKLVELPEDTYFVFDLIGLKVVDHQTGQTIGTVSDIEQYPSSDVYVIAKADGGTVRCPAVKPFVQSVDTKAGQIVIQAAGLEDAM